MAEWLELWHKAAEWVIFRHQVRAPRFLCEDCAFSLTSISIVEVLIDIITIALRNLEQFFIVIIDLLPFNLEISKASCASLMSRQASAMLVSRL